VKRTLLTNFLGALIETQVVSAMIVKGDRLHDRNRSGRKKITCS
jgi:hypothetical protein